MESVHRSQYETHIVESMPKIATYSSAAFLIGTIIEALMPPADTEKNIIYIFIEICVAFLIMSISLISLSLFSTGPGLAGILVYAMILFAIQENTLEKIKIMSDKFISIFSDETPTTQTQQAPMKKPDETTQVTEREVEQAQTQKTVSSTEKSVQQITPVDEDITETSAIEAYYNGEDDGATSLSALF